MAIRNTYSKAFKIDNGVYHRISMARAAVVDARRILLRLHKNMRFYTRYILHCITLACVILICFWGGSV